MVRGVIALPGGLGKEVRVAVFAKGDKIEEAKKAGLIWLEKMSWWKRLKPAISILTAVLQRLT